MSLALEEGGQERNMPHSALLSSGAVARSPPPAASRGLTRTICQDPPPPYTRALVRSLTAKRVLRTVLSIGMAFAIFSELSRAGRCATLHNIFRR